MTPAVRSMVSTLAGGGGGGSSSRSRRRRRGETARDAWAESAGATRAKAWAAACVRRTAHGTLGGSIGCRLLLTHWRCSAVRSAEPFCSSEIWIKFSATTPAIILFMQKYERKTQVMKKAADAIDASRTGAVLKANVSVPV
jgi:hypothetical protein